MSSYLCWKRCIDFLLSLLLLLLFLPFFLLIAIAIKLDSNGPIIFKQWRAGLNGKPFVFYKFRSMVSDAEQRKGYLAHKNERSGPIFKICKDPRITKVGKILRKYSLDELPQLWNVLKGDMSMVGPRPPTLDEVARYDSWARERLNIKGGITCIWQVSGRSNVSFDCGVRMDLLYIQECSFLLDMKLLLLTIPAVIKGKGAY